jgi:hypothetical protein
MILLIVNRRGETPPPISQTWHGDTLGESATTGKALVRAVAQGRGEFPGGVRQCSGKRYDVSIRPFRGTSKAHEETRGLQFETVILTIGVPGS